MKHKFRWAYVLLILAGLFSAPLGLPVSLGMERTGDVASAGYGQDSISDSKILFANEIDGNSDIYVMYSDGTGLERLTYHEAYDGIPDWSPDGSKIAFESFRDGNYEIYIMDADGANITRITENNTREFNPKWSPSGTQIAFMSDRDGDHEIYVMDKDGSNVIQLTHNEVSDLGPVWSPDGERIAFHSTRDWKSEIYVIDADGSNPTRLTTNDYYDNFADWSRATNMLAFHSLRENVWNIYVMNPDGTGEKQVTTTGGVSASWSPNGDQIVFSGKNIIYKINSDGTNIVPLTDELGGEDPAPDWGPNLIPIDFDLSLISVSPVQVVDLDQLPENERYLVKGKATAVKVQIQKTGTESVNNVQVRLTFGSKVIEKFYVADEANTDPFNHGLIFNNGFYHLDFGEGDQTKVIYYFSDDLIPLENTYQISATIEFPKDMNEDNDTLALDPLKVIQTQWSDAENPDLYIQYFRTDWDRRFTEFANFTEYSDRFIQGILPIATDQYRSDISRIRNYSTLPFRSLFSFFDNRLDRGELAAFMYSIMYGLRLAYADADRFVAVVPADWFANFTVEHRTSRGIWSDDISELIIAEALTMPKPNGLSTAGHEVGHSYGLPAPPPENCAEEYDPGCVTEGVAGIGNYSAPGVFVSSRIPIQNKIPIDREVFCLMGRATGDLTEWEYWIDERDYQELLVSHTVGQNQFALDKEETKTILVGGIIDTNNDITLDNWYLLNNAHLSELTPGLYAFEYRDASDTLLGAKNFDVKFDLGGVSLEQSPFVFTIPYINGTTKIEVTYNGVVLAEKEVSGNAPSVTVISPNRDELLSGTSVIKWTGTDLDGDSLTYAVLISADNGGTWEPLATDLDETKLVLDVSQFPAGANYLVKVIATDGFNTGNDASDYSFTILDKIYLPMAIK
jgi:Tol biopolymer transport system component